MSYIYIYYKLYLLIYELYNKNISYVIFGDIPSLFFRGTHLRIVEPGGGGFFFGVPILG